MTVDLPFLDKFNGIIGLIIAILVYFLGDHWFLFVAFLFLNIVDYATGCMKAYILHKTNSSKGFQGILKKFGYWIMISIAFMLGEILNHFGRDIGIDLHMMKGIGYFVLASLLINEVTSIIENLVQAGFKVPKILMKGLELAGKALDKFEDKVFDNNYKEEKTDEDSIT